MEVDARDEDVVPVEAGVDGAWRRRNLMSLCAISIGLLILRGLNGCARGRECVAYFRPS